MIRWRVVVVVAAAAAAAAVRSRPPEAPQ